MPATRKISKTRSKQASKKRQTQSQRAGLQFNVARVTRYLKRSNNGLRVRKISGVYLSAVLEYCTAEVLELAGNNAKDRKKKTIAPKDILIATKNDDELNHLLSNVVIPSSGVVPNIHKSLLPRNPKKSTKSTN